MHLRDLRHAPHLSTWTFRSAGAHGWLKEFANDDVVYVYIGNAYCDNVDIFHGITVSCVI